MGRRRHHRKTKDHQEDAAQLQYQKLANADSLQDMKDLNKVVAAVLALGDPTVKGKDAGLPGELEKKGMMAKAWSPKG